ncbi:SDR family oxidoreductase [Archangium primigenium]|uniref:SDR family oxidoreductase n=1 Tax=[Archangium] primigenium TaxID=2792470 RepID=UPI0019563990|nr:SDR family oxidoreductase [Archangium primigenium]MBM7112004.1 SDR family oxidoreductase [Archangium primigenium]
MTKKDSDILSRRQAVGGLLTGVAVATVASPAAAQPAPDAGVPAAAQATPPPAVPDHPRPPFPAQQQPWPGLASKMDPRPDHGEKSYVGSGRLRGRKALITGGDSGIGRAAAIAYAREGADVAISYLPAEEPDAKEVVALIRAEGRKAVALPGDIRTEAFCKKLVASAVAQLGGLDILVNNAARQKPHASILDLSAEDFDWTIKTNLYAMFWITKAAVPHLPAGAAIINTASVQGYAPSPQLLDYATTKGAIVTFSKALAKQLADKNIRVNAVAPGPFWTPLQPSGGQFPDKLPGFGQDTPLGRPGQPVELASVYVLLASHEASYITGQVYGASGGAGNP